LRNGAQHIPGARDIGQINFGLDFFFAVAGGPRLLRRARSGLAGTKMLANQLRFVLFQRTGVRLLLGNAHRRQHVKNFLALDFQLTGQIIDSNLHPLCVSSKYPLNDHFD
jgi:hypothetical protein